MPGPFDYFSPGEWNDPLQSDPRLATGLLQAGIALSQPRAWGQSGFGALTSAIGSGGEAVARAQEGDRKQQETDIRQQEANSRQDLRAAQADSAMSRAQVAQMGAETANRALDLKHQRLQLDQQKYENDSARLENQFQQKMDLAQQKLKLAQTDQERKQARDQVDQVAKEHKAAQDELRTGFIGRRIDLGVSTQDSMDRRLGLQNTVRLQGLYQQEADAIRKANEKNRLLNPTAVQPIPSYQDWLAKNPHLMGVGGQPGGQPTPDATPPAGRPTSTPSQQPATPPQATASQGTNAPARPSTPEEAMKLAPGTRYINPETGKVMIR